MNTIRIFIADSKRESLNQTCKELGNPKLIGKELTATSSVENAHQKCR